MSEILSSEEIAQLLAASQAEAAAAEDLDRGATTLEAFGPESAASPDSSGASAKAYDFRHPNLASKDHLRIIQLIHERYAKFLESFFTNKLRSVVDIKLMTVNQETYLEFITAMSDPSCAYIIGLKALNGEAILEISPSLVFFMVDRLFGGAGRTLDAARELTTIEQQVIGKIADTMVTTLNTAWEEMAKLDGHVKSFQSRPSFIQLAAMEEMMISVSYAAQVATIAGTVRLSFPFLLLEDVLPQLNSKKMVYAKGEKRSADDRRMILARLQSMSLKVRSILGATRVPLRELTTLQPGDVVVLNEKITDDIRITINDLPAYYARPGTVGKKRGLQITRPFPRTD
jgi:flagellar motor switch protein FliM